MVLCYFQLNFKTFKLSYSNFSTGYSASSGLSQIIQEADAGCTYEGDNVVLLLQTARYLLKCVQKNDSPHLELDNQNEIKASSLYKKLNEYIEIFFRLFEE
jgi:hypothetical protein